MKNLSTRYPKENATVAVNTMSARERETLQEGQEVIVSVNYGKHRLRETITKRTEKQVTLSNGSRYSLGSGKKIGTSESYSPPSILGTPKHTWEEADRRNAAVVAAAQEAERAADLADILDRIESHAKDGETTVPEVLAALSRLHQTRTH